MADWETTPLFDATDRLVLRYAEVLTRENRVDDGLYAELEARFPREELAGVMYDRGPGRIRQPGARDISDGRGMTIPAPRSVTCPSVRLAIERWGRV